MDATIGRTMMNPPGRGTAVRNVACPQCGGALKRKQGVCVLDCRYCGTRSFVEGVEVVARYRLKHIGKHRAVATAKALLKDRRAAKDLAVKAKPHDLKLVLLPFYEFHARKVGSMERRERTYDKSTGEYREDVDSRIMLSDFVRHCPAAEGEHLGYDTIEIEKVRLCPEPVETQPLHDPECMEPNEQVFDPTLPLEAVRSRLCEAYSSRTVKFDIDLKDERVSLLYYPVWLCRLSYGRSIYSIHIDGVTGRVLEARLPANESRRFLAFLALALCVGLPTGKLLTSSGIVAVKAGLAFAAFQPVLGIPLLLVAFIPLLFLLSACWSNLRFSKELVCRGARSSVEMVGKKRDTALERAAAGIMSFLFNTANRAIEFERQRWDR